MGIGDLKKAKTNSFEPQDFKSAAVDTVIVVVVCALCLVIWDM